METAILVEPRKERKRFLSDLLKREGIRVETFDTAEEAVGQASKATPDLFIVDIKMPTKSGLGVVEQLKGLNLPVILITAKESVALEHDLYSLGDVLQAPITDQAFRARIQGILKRRSRRVPAKVSSHPIASHVLSELHDPVTGRLDAGRIADFVGTPLSSFAKLSQVSVAGLHKSPASVSTQIYLIPIARSLTILSQLLGSRENVRVWMNSPHPDLGSQTPISVILEGNAQVVTDLLEAALAGQPS
jgi:DNA-binding response OmpR family regulator